MGRSLVLKLGEGLGRREKLLVLVGLVIGGALSGDSGALVVPFRQGRRGSLSRNVTSCFRLEPEARVSRENGQTEDK
jgi:hypothetical protein